MRSLLGSVPFTILQASPSAFQSSFLLKTHLPFLLFLSFHHLWDTRPTPGTATRGGKCCFPQCSHSLLMLTTNYIKANCPRQGDSHTLIFKSWEHLTFKSHTWTEWCLMLCVTLTRARYWPMDPGTLCSGEGTEEWDPDEPLDVLDYSQLLQTDWTGGGEKAKLP